MRRVDDSPLLLLTLSGHQQASLPPDSCKQLLSTPQSNLRILSAAQERSKFGQIRPTSIQGQDDMTSAELSLSSDWCISMISTLCQIRSALPCRAPLA